MSRIILCFIFSLLSCSVGFADGDNAGSDDAEADKVAHETFDRSERDLIYAIRHTEGAQEVWESVRSIAVTGVAGSLVGAGLLWGLYDTLSLSPTTFGAPVGVICVGILSAIATQGKVLKLEGKREGQMEELSQLQQKEMNRVDEKIERNRQSQ